MQNKRISGFSFVSQHRLTIERLPERVPPKQPKKPCPVPYCAFLCLFVANQFSFAVDLNSFPSFWRFDLENSNVKGRQFNPE
jgi:hypothetical protein